MNCTYLGYDNIIYQFGLNNEIHTKPINVWPITPQKRLNLNDWGDHLLKLGVESKDMLFVLPNRQYENKKSLYSFYKRIVDSYRGYNINVVTETTALATYLSEMNYNDGKYRIINLSQKVVQIHDLEIRQNQYFYLNSQELSWSTPKYIHQYFENKADTFFTLKGIDNQKKVFNQIYCEDFKALLPKYYCYRVDYESTVTYENIYEIMSEWKEDYFRIMNLSTSASTDAITLYCGELLDLDFFTESINIADQNRIDFRNVLTSLNKIKKTKFCLETDIELTLCGLEYRQVSVLSKNDVEGSNNYFDRDKSILIKKIRVPVANDNEPKYPLSLIYNNQQYDGFVNIDWSDIVHVAFQTENTFHKWIEVDLSMEVDDCDNIVLNIFQKSILIHTESIAKLKKHELKHIIS